MKKIVGIFSGTFDPVHEGHIEFVLKAIKELQLHHVYVIPERTPRGKQNVTTIDHRVHMLELVFNNNPSVSVYNQPLDFSIFPDTLDDPSLLPVTHLLIGSDVAFTLKTWPNLAALLRRVQLIIAVRDGKDTARIHTLMGHLGVLPGNYTVVATSKAAQASSHARTGLASFHPKIQSYIKKHQLYKV